MTPAAPPQAVFAALADPTRREVLERLATDGAATPTRLAAALPITRQAVSKHLASLADAGLVSEHRAGRERRYTFTPEPLEDAASWMAAIGARWDRRLADLERYLRTTDGDKAPTDANPATRARDPAIPPPPTTPRSDHAEPRRNDEDADA